LVSAEHLKAAAGDVRCGQCLAVFNALNNLSEAAPPQTAAPEFESEPSPDISVTDDDVENEPPHYGELDPTSRAAQALEALLEKNDTMTETEPSPEETRILPDDDLQQHTAHRDTAEMADEESESLAIFFADTHEETDAVSTDSDNPVVETQTPLPPAPDNVQANVPAVILQQWQEEKEAQLRPSSAPWVMGSLFLMLLLVAQTVYFQRDELVRDPQYRDWIIKACEIADCTLAVPYDIKQIDIISHDVRSHPSAKNGLIAATILINNAPFPQPFPLLTLTFSDINGTRLAQRRFTPSEYLDAHTDVDAGMPPDRPVQIELKLMDPGKAAVNFEFRAERDPRSVQWRGRAG